MSDESVRQLAEAVLTACRQKGMKLATAESCTGGMVAAAMAEGALARAPVDLSVAITGIAGPGGGTAAKPVGLVWFASAQRGGQTVTETHIFSGDRAAVRLAATRRALELLLAAVH